MTNHVSLTPRPTASSGPFFSYLRSLATLREMPSKPILIFPPFPGLDPMVRYGPGVASVGQIDSGPAPDFAVGDPGAFSDDGLVTIYSGDTGLVIMQYRAENQQARLGHSIVTLKVRNGIPASGDW